MAEDSLAAAASEDAGASAGALDNLQDQPQNTTNPSLSLIDTKSTVDATLEEAQQVQPAETMVGNVSETSAAGPSPTSPTIGPVPLDSSLRTAPIHPSVPNVRVPQSATPGSSEPNLNPITLKPFTETELAKYGFEKLRAQLLARTFGVEGAAAQKTATGNHAKVDDDEVKKVREETAALLKQKLEEREAKIREIEREMGEKDKIREVERKVFRKKMGGGAAVGAKDP